MKNACSILKKSYKFKNKNLLLNFRDEADISVANEIFVLREYGLMEKIIQKSAYPILDIGAHAGYFTLYCRALNDKIKIFCFEPEPRNFQFLKNNLKENKIKNVKSSTMAISAKTGLTNLFISNDSHNHSIVKEYLPLATKQKTTAISLPDFFTQNKIKKISLLKMDIEGAEYKIFKSLKKTDWEKISNIILEYHQFGKNKVAELENILIKNNFSTKKEISRFDKKMGFLVGRKIYNY